MNLSQVQSANMANDLDNSIKDNEVRSLAESELKVEYTCMSCDKRVSNIETHLKEYHNIDCFQVIDNQSIIKSDSEQNENFSFDVSQNDIKSEILGQVDAVLDCVSLAELEGYLPATDYSVISGEDKMTFVCKNCDSNFKNFVDLKDHSITQHNNLIQRRDCRHCNIMLDSHRKLMEHLKENHGTYRQFRKIQKIIDQVKKNGSPSNALKNENSEHLQSCFSCTECGKIFRMKSSLVLHRRRMHSTRKFPGKDGKMSFWCLECRLSFPDVRDLKKHFNDNHGCQSFLCLNCDTMFPSRGNLNLHNIYHHRIHWCSTCNVTFPGRLALTAHVKQYHPGMPIYRANSRFVCEYCSQSFSIRSQLSDHIQSIHLGLINRCEDCGKVLSTSETLKIHRLKHRPEMHRTCEHCGRQFYRTGMLTEHIRACHPEALPEDWKLHTTCPYCQTSFTRRESMRRHIEAKHEPKSLSCSFCERLFTCRRYLVRHENKHHLARTGH